MVTLVTRARLGFGSRLSGERSGGCGRRIGEEIGYRTRHYMCFLDTAYSEGIDFRKGLGASRAAQTDRGQQGRAVRRGGGGRSSTLCKSVREFAAAARGALKKHRP